MSVSRCPICGGNNRKREQKLIDMLFEVAVRMQMGEIAPSSREAAAAYIAVQLEQCGFATEPAGSSWGVLK